MPKFKDVDIAADAIVGARKLRAVTPHAENNLPGGVCDALWINDEGVKNVAVIAEDDTAAVVMTISGPGPLDVRAKAVRVSGTTATNIVAMY